MNNHILVSCLAASFLLSGAAIAPSWALSSDQHKSGQVIFADGDQNEQAPQEEKDSNDKDGYLINTQPSGMDIAQSEEGAGSEAEQPKPEGEGGGD